MTPHDTFRLPRPKRVERILFAGEAVAICSFRCAADDPLFGDSGPSNADAVVFPRNSVRVLRERGVDRVTSVHEVSLYREGEEYRRLDVDGRGSQCDWYVIAPRPLRDILGRIDPAAAERTRPLFPAPIVACDARSYARQRQVFRHVERWARPDVLWVEETMLNVIAHLLIAGGPARAALPLSPTRASLAEEAKRLLAATATENLPLAELARRLETSEFHLARVFRRHTGSSLHRYRDELRLRLSLERLLESDVELSMLAVDLGYSHHSHFTQRFRRAFGVTPSGYRRRRMG